MSAKIEHWFHLSHFGIESVYECLREVMTQIFWTQAEPLNLSTAKFEHAKVKQMVNYISSVCCQEIPEDSIQQKMWNSSIFFWRQFSEIHFQDIFLEMTAKIQF